MKRRRAGALALLVLLLLPLCGCAPQADTREIFAMDTVMELTVYGSGAADRTRETAELLSGLEAKLSVTRADSEVARLNADKTVDLSKETAELLRRSLRLRDETGGALEPFLYPLTRLWGFTTGDYRVPSDAEIAETLAGIRGGSYTLEGDTASLHGLALDFGAVAKGYAGQLAAERLRAAGVSSAILSLGGNVQTVGLKPDGSLWNVAIRDPEDPEGYLGVLAVGETAVVTSGGYQRYFEEDGVRYIHILDPETGRPADAGLSSVTIVSADGLLADGLSTALYVLGLDRAEALWRDRSDFEAVLVAKDGAIYVTAGLAEAFSGAEFQVIER